MFVSLTILEGIVRAFSMPQGTTDEEGQQQWPTSDGLDELRNKQWPNHKGASDMAILSRPSACSIKEPYSWHPDLGVGVDASHPYATPRHLLQGPAKQIRYSPKKHSLMLDLTMCRVTNMTALLILVFGLLLIIGPLWLLNMLSTEKAKLTAISILVASFVGLLGLGTGAEPFETLAAAAA